MKAIVVEKNAEAAHLNLIEKSEPKPAPGEVLVRWRATSLNYHDYLVGNGTLPVAEGRIPMSDGAGEVIETGHGVDQWQPGDRVMSMFFPGWIDGPPTRENTAAIAGEVVDGCAVEMSAVPAATLTGIPDGYNFAEAATLPCAALTAWRALVVEGKLKAGQSVLVEGSGGMSIFALQIAKAAGATVYATTSSADKAAKLKALGATAVINYREDPKWGKTIAKMSDGGVDHVLDVGGAATYRQSVEAARMYGKVYSIGILGGPLGEILFPKLFFKHIHLIGLAVGSREMQEEMVAAINRDGLRPVIDRRYSGLDSLSEAFDYQESGAHFGKIVVEF